MDLVADANIIFAALIKESKTHELIFDEKLHLFTTEFFFTEFEKHAKEIQEKQGGSMVVDGPLIGSEAAGKSVPEKVTLLLCDKKKVEIDIKYLAVEMREAGRIGHVRDIRQRGYRRCRAHQTDQQRGG